LERLIEIKCKSMFFLDCFEIRKPLLDKEAVFISNKL
jgi:hypothetical protein